MPCKRNTTSLVMNDHRLVIVPCLRLVSASCKILLGPRLAIAQRNTRTTIANCNHNHTSKMKPTKPSLFAFGVATTTPLHKPVQIRSKVVLCLFYLHLDYESYMQLGWWNHVVKLFYKHENYFQKAEPQPSAQNLIEN